VLALASFRKQPLAAPPSLADDDSVVRKEVR
jgi:hypothetical protein